VTSPIWFADHFLLTQDMVGLFFVPEIWCFWKPTFWRSNMTKIIPQVQIYKIGTNPPNYLGI
jgi:hypothetical protein